MCGICGKLNFDRQKPADARLLRQMMDLLQHRGPDGSGEFCSGPVSLGHRRLSIIDLNTGGQPISNEDGTIWVVYNGEIYNFLELRNELEDRGHLFKSTTDTEVIVHMYEECGMESIGRLRGMFAFALWDESKQLLLLARDRVGIKPIYYTNTGKSLVFASEIKSIIADQSVSRCINHRAIDRFLTYYYLPGNETLFERIHKLEPGCYLTVRDGEIAIKQYWDLQYQVQSTRANFTQSVEALQVLLRHTVRDHMISDVPVGVLLSGGVDSTGVLRYAAEQTGKPIHTFTVGFAGEQFADERSFAQLAANRYGTLHQEITITAKDFIDFFPQFVWHMEEPVCEPPAIALYFVSRLARESSVKVLLSGEGGDEAFGGYQNYRNLLFFEALKSKFGPAKGLLRLSFQALGRIGWKKVEVYSKLIDPELSSYYLSRTATPATTFNRIKDSLYTQDFFNILENQESNAPTFHLFERVKNQSLLNRMLYVDTKTWLPDDLLIKADKITMATSVELRVPLLDYKILEFAASLPQCFKVRGWETKRILKAALADSVPPEIIKRKKTGFPVPYERWLREEFKDYVFDIILGQESYLTTYFCKDEIRRLVINNIEKGGAAKEVFCLIFLQLWHQIFLQA